MPAGRKIPRTPPKPPERPPPPEHTGDAPEDVAKAAGELTSLAAAIGSCEACGRGDALRAYGTGFPRAPIMLLKDRPSEGDLETAAAFSTEAEALGRAFDALKIPVAWVYGTTAVRCGSQGTTADELGACSTHLLVEIEAVEPRVIVAFGPAAVATLRQLDGRCGLRVPARMGEEPVTIRRALTLIATEPLPEGITDNESKRRLWRDLQRLPELLA